MDLFRISRKSTRELFEYMSDLLDGERSLLGEEKEPEADVVFEARSDIEELLKCAVNGRTPQHRCLALFHKLNPFFEAGFLLVKHEGAWVVGSMFLYGKKFEMPERARVPFGIPQMRSNSVVKGRSPAVLKAFELEGIARLRDSHAFLFDVGQDSIFLLLSEKPYPWLDELVRKTRMVLTSLYDSVRTEANGRYTR
jgi:hypothetical protein